MAPLDGKKDGGVLYLCDCNAKENFGPKRAHSIGVR